MSYTADEISKAKELYRKQGGSYPQTSQELIEALELLFLPDKKVKQNLVFQS